ncbi:uncharacterized protein LOC130678224 [Microplitis mediator]|uniref:uncharacterized protein LOC130678224 n=1 Tax=Microplitis mediator TaxID=375433 RepID=UPI0025532ACE|nr:uncharacterized protein LOC130678224 [Microplitis mediator]
MGSTKGIYCVVKFIEMPFLYTEEYQVVPSSWIAPGVSEQQVLVTFPLMDKTKLLNVVKNRRPASEKWLSFPATIEFITDNFDHAMLYLDLLQ